MAFNRFADRRIDGLNPRTRERELPRGAVTERGVLGLVAAASVVFVGGAFALNRLAGWLSFPVLAVLFSYSAFKRFSWFAHGVLGLCLAFAPLGAWVAVRGDLRGDLAPPLLLAAAVLTWVAGFDLIYACQDVRFRPRAPAPLRPGALRRGLGFARLHRAARPHGGLPGAVRLADGDGVGLLGGARRRRGAARVATCDRGAARPVSREPGLLHPERLGVRRALSWAPCWTSPRAEGRADGQATRTRAGSAPGPRGARGQPRARGPRARLRRARRGALLPRARHRAPAGARRGAGLRDLLARCGARQPRLPSRELDRRPLGGRVVLSATAGRGAASRRCAQSGRRRDPAR